MGKIYPITNDADNITLLDPKLKKNGNDVGFLDGETTVDYGLTKYKLEVGSPKLSAGQIITAFLNKIKSKIVELTPENFCFGMGMSEDSLVRWDGLTEYAEYWKDALKDRQLLVFAPYEDGFFEAVETDHKNIVSVTDVPVITPLETTETPNPTPYVYLTDYWIDYINGVIYRIPGGSIPSKAPVRVKYKCIPSARVELPLTRGKFALWTGEIELTGTDASTGKRIIDYIPRAQVSGGGLVTASGSAWGLDIEINAIDNPGTPDTPLGYMIRDVEAAVV